MLIINTEELQLLDKHNDIYSEIMLQILINIDTYRYINTCQHFNVVVLNNCLAHNISHNLAGMFCRI